MEKTSVQQCSTYSSTSFK